MEVIIRKAEEQDIGSIALLLTELGYPSDDAFVRAKLREFAAYPSSRVFVAEQAGIVVGFISFDSQPLFHQAGKIGTIMALCVAGSHRASGIGGQLVAHVEREAWEAGCVKIAVASGMRREDAHRFYRKCGYEETTKRFLKLL